MDPESDAWRAAERGGSGDAWLSAFLLLGVLKAPRVTVPDAFGTSRPRLSGRPAVIPRRGCERHLVSACDPRGKAGCQGVSSRLTLEARAPRAPAVPCCVHRLHHVGLSPAIPKEGSPQTDPKQTETQASSLPPRRRLPDFRKTVIAQGKTPCLRSQRHETEMWRQLLAKDWTTKTDF